MKNEAQKVFVFDFDGTIVDSMSAFADIAAAVMPRRLPINSTAARRLYLETSGIPFFQQLEVLFPGDPANKDTAEEFEKAKLEGYFREPLFDDAKDTIDHLRYSGIRTVVSSNNFQNLVDQYLEKNHIQFDMVLGFKENFSKGTDHFKHIEKMWNVDKNSVTYVGDSIKDGERATEYGISFIGKEGTFTRNDFLNSFPNAKVITNLSELKMICR